MEVSATKVGECHLYVLVCHRVLLVCTVMSLVCTRMSFVVTSMYSYVKRMSLVSNRMSPLCLSCVFLCHRLLLVYGFTMNPNKNFKKNLFGKSLEDFANDSCVQIT